MEIVGVMPSVFALVLAVGALAAYLPAHRAVRGDPQAILRQG